MLVFGLLLLALVAACGQTAPPETRPSPVAAAPAGAGGAAGDTTERAPTSGGAAMYRYYCAQCHGATGLGDGPSVGSLRTQGGLNLTILGSKSDDEIYNTISAGKGTEMPPWELVLTPDQRRELVAYLRTLGK